MITPSQISFLKSIIGAPTKTNPRDVKINRRLSAIKLNGNLSFFPGKKDPVGLFC
jgi:hypothetical protein